MAELRITLANLVLRVTLANLAVVIENDFWRFLWKKWWLFFLQNI